MTAQEALKVALRDVLGPCARSHGFKGTAPTWRKSTPAGDWAVVNVQSSSFSSAEHLKCVINLAIAPEPWLRWSRVKLGAAMPKSVTESLGLYRERLLKPENMLGQIRSGILGHWRQPSAGVLFARAEALLLMDGGPSPELHGRLHFGLENCIPQQRDNALQFDSWVREQANHAD